MTLNYIERMTRYNKLKHDFDLQCLENSRKQEQIIELRRTNRELESQVAELKKELEILGGRNDKNRNGKKSFNRK